MNRTIVEAPHQQADTNGSAGAATTAMAYTAAPPAANRVPACAYCKRLKVRCERSIPNDASSPCLRCTRSHRECVMVNSKRKYPTEEHDKQQSAQKKRPETNQQPSLLVRRTSIDVNNVREQLVASWNILTERDNLRLRLLEKRPHASIARPEDNVINQGLFTRNQIKQRLDLYRNEIWPVCPVVKAPDGDNIEELFVTAPVLMHTILDVSSIVVRDPSQIESSVILHNVVFRTVIDEYMIMSMKNMELLKSLVLLIHWYNESELYHQQRLRALTTLAVSLSYDLGLGGSMPPGCSTGKVPIFEQIVTPQVIADPYDPECLNTWLSVYSFSFQETVSNRRPIMSLWNSYTSEAVDRLENEFGPTSDPRIFHLWEFASIRRLSERITLELFKRGNEPRVPDFSSTAVQYLIHHFDVEINALEPRIGYQSPRRRIAFLLVRAYLHQAILYTDFNEALGRSPFTNFSLNLHSGPLTLQGAQSFSTCFRSACEVLKLVASLTPVQIASMVNSFWSSVVVSCDLVLKCRALCIFNRNFATACFVSEDELSHVMRVMALGDEVVSLYPNDNAAVSYMFLVKLLVCHHDARLHFLASTPQNWVLGDTSFLYNLPNEMTESPVQSGVLDRATLLGKVPTGPVPEGDPPRGIRPDEELSAEQKRTTAVINRIAGVSASDISEGQISSNASNYSPSSNGGETVPLSAGSFSSHLSQPVMGMHESTLSPPQQSTDSYQAYKLVPQLSPSQPMYSASNFSDDSPDYARTAEEEILNPITIAEQQQESSQRTNGGAVAAGSDYPLSNVDDFWRDFMNQSIGPVGTDFQV